MTFKIIWCLLGLIGWFFTYHTVSKYWYFNSPEDFKTKRKTLLLINSICFPIWILGGLWSIIFWAFCYERKYWSLYFK